MEAIIFTGANTIFAKDQPEYKPLHALRKKDPEGTVITCWQLSEEDKKKILETGVVWSSMYTFNKPLQPVLLTANKEDLL